MRYLLDSDTCIVHLRSGGGGGGQVSRRLRAARVGEIALATIVVSELVYGALRSRDVARNLAAVQVFCGAVQRLPLDEPVAEVHARIRSELADRGTPIGPYDSIIAATALVHGLTLVTHNTREFGRVSGLALEDWQMP